MVVCSKLWYYAKKFLCERFYDWLEFAAAVSQVDHLTAHFSKFKMTYFKVQVYCTNLILIYSVSKV